MILHALKSGIVNVNHFKGKAGRLEYTMMIMMSLSLVIIAMLGMMIVIKMPIWFIWLLYLVGLYCFLSTIRRRWNDMGATYWKHCVLLIPLFPFIMMFVPSDEGNQYCIDHDHDSESIDGQKQSFVSGEEVKIIQGPLSGFRGIITNVNNERGRLTVEVNTFNFITPVPFYFDEVQKTGGHSDKEN